MLECRPLRTSPLQIGGGEFLQCGLHAPDLAGILGDGAVTGELTAACNVVDHLLGPFLGVLEQGYKQGTCCFYQPFTA